MENYAVKLFESLQKLKVTDENREEVEKIKQEIRNKEFKKALDRIEKIQNASTKKDVKNEKTEQKESNKKSKKKKDEDKPKENKQSKVSNEKSEEENNKEHKKDNQKQNKNEENQKKEEKKEEQNEIEDVKDEDFFEDTTYKSASDVDDDDFFQNDEYDELSEDPLYKRLKEYNDENNNYSDDYSDEDDTNITTENDIDSKMSEDDTQEENNNEEKDEDTENSENDQDGEQSDDEDNTTDEETEEQDEGIYPKQLRNEELEHIYLGMLLNNPKLITKYYITKKECHFEDDKCTEVYKSVLFTEGSKYTPEVAKDGYNLPKYNNEIREFKEDLMAEYMDENYNIEEIYIELKKLFILRKSYLENPIKENQDKIVEIINYVLYKSMSVEEVESAVNQVTVTGKFKQAVLNKDLTSFLEMGDNTLTNGLEFPFHILSSVFKGLRKGETMAFAMPSNSGKSRFTINLAAYTAFIHKKKVLIISNEMSEDKMKLCLITTIINNPEIQKLHGQDISKTEGELLEFKFRPDDPKKVKVDENGFVVKEEKESQADFVKRLTGISTEFNKTIKAVDWANKEINNSIYFINITDHTNDELKKVIMNYYYKEKIEYVFYDTLKTDTANIGKGEEIKKTATILSNLAQNFNMFIYSTLQLTESTTLPINLDVNDLAVSRTVKEVLDTLCLIKQINKETYDDYEYSLKEVDTKYFDLKKYTDPDVRYYACVVDKNRAGAKPKVLFRLNLAYNRWEELGYLRMKQQIK
jgi:replicative DNA helicase